MPILHLYAHAQANIVIKREATDCFLYSAATNRSWVHTWFCKSRDLCLCFLSLASRTASWKISRLCCASLPARSTIPLRLIRVYTEDMHIKNNQRRNTDSVIITYGASLLRGIIGKQKAKKRKQGRISGSRARSRPAHGLHVHAFAPQDVILQIDNATIA